MLRLFATPKTTAVRPFRSIDILPRLKGGWNSRSERITGAGAARPLKGKITTQRTQRAKNRLMMTCDQEAAVVLAGAFNRDFDVAVTHKAGKFFAPLDEQNRVISDEVIEAERLQLTRRIHAVKINVVDVHLGAAIFVYQGKGWAGHILLAGSLKTFCDTFDESSLAGAQIAAQQHQPRRGESGGQIASQGNGFVGRVGDKFLRAHAEIQYIEPVRTGNDDQVSGRG